MLTIRVPKDQQHWHGVTKVPSVSTDILEYFKNENAENNRVVYKFFNSVLKWIFFPFINMIRSLDIEISIHLIKCTRLMLSNFFSEQKCVT